MTKHIVLTITGATGARFGVVALKRVTPLLAQAVGATL